MSSVTASTDLRRPKKVKRFIPVSSDAPPADPMLDYMVFFSMVMSMCGLAFEVGAVVFLEMHFTTALCFRSNQPVGWL